MISIVSDNGKSIESAVSDLLKRISNRLGLMAKPMQDQLLQQTRRHISRRYPGSTHWNPSKVIPGALGLARSMTTAEVDIGIPGATRAYRDITILPRFRKALTIPLAKEAVGKKASDFSDLFVVNKKNGKAFLAQRQPGGNIKFLFTLAKSAFQKQDPTLLPTDEAYANGLISRISRELQRTKL